MLIARRATPHRRPGERRAVVVAALQAVALPDNRGRGVCRDTWLQSDPIQLRRRYAGIVVAAYGQPLEHRLRQTVVLRAHPSPILSVWRVERLETSNIQHPTSNIQARKGGTLNPEPRTSNLHPRTPWLAHHVSRFTFQAPLRLPRGHPEATLKPYGRQPVATLKPPRGYPEATLKPPSG